MIAASVVLLNGFHDNVGELQARLLIQATAHDLNAYGVTVKCTRIICSKIRTQLV